MIPVTPPVGPAESTLVIYAVDQPEYHNLPAYRTVAGTVMCEFELDAAELDRVCRGGRIRLWVYTFNKPLQPIALEVADPWHSDNDNSA